MTAYIAATACAAGGLLAFWLRAWRGEMQANAGTFLTLIVAACVAQHFYVPVAPRRKVDVSIAAYFASLLLLGAPVSVMAVGLAQLMGQSTLALRRDPRTGRRRRSLRSIVFNTAQFMVATGVAAFVYYGALPHQAPARLERPENLWALPAAALAMYLANSFAVAGIIGLQRGQSLMDTWLTGRRGAALYLAALCAIAALALRALPHDPWVTVLLLLSGAVAYSAIERSDRLTDHTRRLRQSEERHRTLIEMAPDVIFSLSVADGAFTTVSPAIERVTQSPPCKWVGQPLTALIHPEDVTLAEQKLAQLRWGQTPTPFELRLRTKAGTYRAVDLTVTPKAEAGIVVEVIGIARDVTTQKTLALLQERERIAMDLHDGAIQSLFAAALSLAAEERALDGSGGNTEAAARTRAALRRTRSQINRVIQDIRSYVYGLRVHDLSRDDLKTGLRTLAEELRLNTPIYPHLAIDLSPETERRLAAGAAECLLHITREATSNVIRHAAASEVTIAISQLDAHHLRLTIRDNGRGFAPSPDGKGYASTLDGQGLHNMATRAQALGGELAVVSQPGSGTEVRLDLPLPENGSAG